MTADHPCLLYGIGLLIDINSGYSVVEIIAILTFFLYLFMPLFNKKCYISLLKCVILLNNFVVVHNVCETGINLYN